MGAQEQVTVAAAADLLGVRRETIYAYVSRGLLDRTYVPAASGGRHSMLDAAQVHALAERTRRPRTGRFELLVDTAVSELDPEGRLRYRGHDAMALADTESLEAVAEILWQSPESVPWRSDDHIDELCLRTSAAAPHAASPAARARIGLSLLAAEADPADPAPLVSARRAIVLAARSLGPTVAPWQGAVAPTVLAALTSETSAASARPAATELIRRALVLLADHELATSTIAARAAASTGASIPVTLLTGAAALGGPRHGQASVAAERLLDRWLVDRELDGEPSGFGHLVYTGPDPRADDLLDATLATFPDLDEPVRALTLAVLRESGRHPNVDLSLAVLVRALSLPPGSGEAIFLVARLAGLTAHALEERSLLVLSPLEVPLRFRPRGLYTG